MVGYAIWMVEVLQPNSIPITSVRIILAQIDISYSLFRSSMYCMPCMNCFTAESTFIHTRLSLVSYFNCRWLHHAEIIWLQTPLYCHKAYRDKHFAYEIPSQKFSSYICRIVRRNQIKMICNILFNHKTDETGRLLQYFVNCISALVLISYRAA
jgi:hypothetical protein